MHSFIILVSGFLGGSAVKNLPANAGDTRDPGSITGWEDPLEKEMATHSSILAWKIHRGAWWATVYGVVKSRRRLSMHSALWGWGATLCPEGCLATASMVSLLDARSTAWCDS